MFPFTISIPRWLSHTMIRVVATFLILISIFYLSEKDFLAFSISLVIGVLMWWFSVAKKKYDGNYRNVATVNKQIGDLARHNNVKNFSGSMKNGQMIITKKSIKTEK